jgi:type I restriction enzyme S subunit
VDIVDETAIHKGFLYFLFNSRSVRSQISGSATGTKVRHTAPERIYRVRACIPEDVAEQGKIASILTAYDHLIENNRRRIQLLEQAARLLYKEWFVHLRFPGHEHVTITDGVPEGWERKTLGDIAQTNVQSHKARSLPDEINYIDIASVSQGRINGQTTMSASEAPGRARRIARDGDVIWSNVRPNLRAYALVLEPEGNDVFSTGFTVLTASSVPFSFLYLLVTTDDFVTHLINHTTGVSYPAVRPDDFERATVLVPPEMLLREFHVTVEPMFRLSTKLIQQNCRLKAARDLLLPRLMNGEIAV